MKRNFILAIVLSTIAIPLLAQTAARTGDARVKPVSSPEFVDVNDKTGNVAMIGDAEIASEIGISLEDHLVSGVRWKVTDNEIDLSGKVPNKLDKQVAHEIAEAYADGRKVRDRVREVASSHK